MYSASAIVNVPLEHVCAILNYSYLWDDKNPDSFRYLIHEHLETKLKQELDMLCWANDFEYQIDWCNRDNFELSTMADRRYTLIEETPYMVCVMIKIKDIVLNEELGISTGDAAERVLEQFWRETTLRFRPVWMEYVNYQHMVGKMAKRWGQWLNGERDIGLEARNGVLGWKWKSAK